MTVTVTPGITAPLESVITPEIDPVIAAQVTTAVNRKNTIAMIIKMHRLSRFICSDPPQNELLGMWSLARCKAKTAAVTNAPRGRALNGDHRKALPASDRLGQSRDSAISNHPKKVRSNW